MIEVLQARLDNHEALIQVLREEIDRLKGGIEDPHFQWVSLADLKKKDKKFTRAYTLKRRAKDQTGHSDWIEGIHWRIEGTRIEYNLVPIMHLHNRGQAAHAVWLSSQKVYSSKKPSHVK